MKKEKKEVKKEVISLIVPCYNEEEALPYYYDAMNKLSKELEQELEFIFVEDGSHDKTLEIIKDLAEKDERVKYISFSRNFGKEAAMYAGFENSTGDYVTTMDADLQDPPELLKEMIRYIKEEGYDSVGVRRVTRKGEPPIRSFFARCFYKLINKMSAIEMVDGARDYRLMTRQMVDALLELKEYNRYSKGLFSFVGFKTKWLEYENVERVAGETKWSFWKLFKYAIEGIVAFSTLPLVLATFIGVVLCFISVFGFILLLVKSILFGDPFGGWSSLVCIILFIGGLQMIFIGILGEYLSKTYLETKKRPIYIIKYDNIDKK